MSFEEEIKNLSNKAEINFIATATTPWHAHGIVACIYYLRTRGFNPVGYIFILPHSMTGYALEKSLFPDLPELTIKRIEKRPLSLFENLKKIYLSVDYFFLRAKRSKHKRILYYVEPWTIDAAQSNIITRHIKDVSIRHIVYDEGVATYFPINLQSNSVSEKIKNLFTKHVTFGIGYRFLVSKGLVTSAKLFNQVGHTIETNTLIIPFYKQAIKSFHTNKSNNYSFPPKTVLICTTAWERKEIVDQEDVRLIKFVNSLLKERGAAVVFKPHPRDYKFQESYHEVPMTLNAKESLESILLGSSTLPVCVLSISSTILVTSRLFFNLKSIDLSGLLDAKKIGRYIDETTAFRNAFGNYVSSPTSIADLLISLDNIN